MSGKPDAKCAQEREASVERSQVHHSKRENLLSNSSEDPKPVDTGKPVAVFSSQSRLNQDTIFTFSLLLLAADECRSLQPKHSTWHDLDLQRARGTCALCGVALPRTGPLSRLNIVGEARHQHGHESVMTSTIPHPRIPQNGAGFGCVPPRASTIIFMDGTPHSLRSAHDVDVIEMGE